jgi:hypothetical protein
LLYDGAFELTGDIYRLSHRRQPRDAMRNPDRDAHALRSLQICLTRRVFRDLHHHARRNGFSAALKVLSAHRSAVRGPGVGEERDAGPRESAVGQIREGHIKRRNHGRTEMIQKILAALGITAAIALSSFSLAGPAAIVADAGTGPSATAGPPWG